ncbi:phosphodiester glycosidase family protein [Fictibacillus enclensis]|uniref:phosphodiester glycosidase family protein n=1 Tax=Fictibacillus enclensis TaxID=1017270 RepID=UPI0025A2FBE5|nr:phosphodiester glycosidase family protein [Fictibacillus enclensis]MDM5340902.1 phosphodiester glycosidase family protein [Fictibacillus enclensis]
MKRFAKNRMGRVAMFFSLMGILLPAPLANAQEEPFTTPKTKEVQKLEKGLTYTESVYGKVSGPSGYMVDAAFTEDQAEAEQLSKELTEKGYKATVKTLADRAQDDPEHGKPLGYLVRTGPFQKESDAKSEQKKLVSAGYGKSKVVYLPEDGEASTGPWAVRILEINTRQWKGSLKPVLAQGVVPGKEKLSDIAKTTHAVAGVNGGYFVMGPQDGTEGDLAGVSVINGDLISEAVKGRTSLVLNRQNQASIASVKTKLTIKGNHDTRATLDGLNRVPGLIRGCGGIGDTETVLPRHDFTCTDPDELIQYTSAFGNRTPEGPGTDVVLDRNGRVLDVRFSRGASIPFGGSVIAGTGDSADWLKEHAVAGKKLSVKKTVTADNKTLPSSAKYGVINGGPRLLKHGKVYINATKEGFHQPVDPEFYYRFGERRNPRTIAGIKPNGTLLLVTVDGKNPGYSIGMTFEEEARLMKALGAMEAVNLDGGGSTTMNVNGELVNDPSDAAGERPIGDGLLLLPSTNQ